MTKQKARHLTVDLIIGTFAVWIAWDVYLSNHHYTTESTIIRVWGYLSTAWPFLLGYLMGHWFVTRRSKIHSGWMYGLPELCALALFDYLWNHYGGGRVWFRYAPIYVFLGMCSGSLFWGMQDKDSPIP